MEVKVDFSDVEPNLLEKSGDENPESVNALNNSSVSENEPSSNVSLVDSSNSQSSDDSSKPQASGKSSRFFRKKND